MTFAPRRPRVCRPRSFPVQPSTGPARPRISNPTGSGRSSLATSWTWPIDLAHDLCATRALCPATGHRISGQPANTRAKEDSMKGVVFGGDRKLELRDFPDPAPGPRDVILEIKASGMCGSALHNYRAPAEPAGTVTGGIKR